MTTSTDSMMPMGQTALKAQGASTALPPLPPPVKGAMALPPLPSAPPPIPAGAPPMAPQTAPVAPPPPAIPWQVKQQPDGSSVNYVPSPDGDSSKDIILSVNPPPKLPRAMQPPAQHQPGQ